MKKIGILTFHKSVNYGSVLQAWATQNILKDKGYNVEVIDYEPEKYKDLYNVWEKGISWSSIKTNIKRALFCKAIKRQIESFEKFRKDELILTKDKYGYSSDYEKMGNSFAAIICGSDQIWNVKVPDCDPIYFLPIKHNCKKIAYAVSINNTDFTEERYKENIKSWILDFDRISDREKSGATKINDFINSQKDVCVTLDPTLLHKKSSFDVITSQKIVSEKYIFMYCASYSHSIVEAAKKIGEKMGLPVYTTLSIKDGKLLLLMIKNGIKVDFQNTAPGDFLSFIKHAEFVVTTSFHGTAFSLIYEKDFLAINEEYEAGNRKDDERIVNILNNLGISERYILSRDVDKFELSNTLNYGNITKKRMELSQQSLEWLIDGIEDKNEDRAL